VWLDVLLQKRVEVEQQQLVDADCPRHHGNDQQPRLEALSAAVQAREEALCEGLRWP
jgi:hypothetical protein